MTRNSYSPTPAMQEHLRLLDTVCALPGCTRNVCTVGEADHIEEYDHADPERGGQTSLENLHRLCWKHHDMKTRGLLDPVREPDGSTTWSINGLARIRSHQNRDLLTPMIADALQRSWEAYEDMLAWEELAWDEGRRRGLLRDADPVPLTAPAPLSDPADQTTRAAPTGSASPPLSASPATSELASGPGSPPDPPF